jgi:uncharacterized protein (DUF4415 family)
MKPTKERSPIREKTNEELAAMADSEIDYSDIPELDEEWFKTAELVYPKPKHSITIRIDDEVYQWFRKQGTGYQSRINAALKSYVQEHKQ